MDDYALRSFGSAKKGVLLKFDIAPAPGPMGGRAQPVCLYIPEITINGAIIDVPDDELWRQLSNIEILLVQCVTRAAIALSWSEAIDSMTLAKLDVERMENQEDIGDPGSTVRQREAARRFREWSIPAGLDAVEQARMERRLEWLTGEVPGEMRSQYAEMYTDLFVFALDNLNRGFMKLQGILLDAEQKKIAGRAQSKLRSRVGDLRQARNSAHHPGDLFLGMGKGKGKERRKGPIKPEPIDRPEIQAPQGAIVRMSTDGRQFSITAGDGSLVDINKTEDALLAAIEAAQLALNAMPRRGLPEIRPR